MNPNPRTRDRMLPSRWLTTLRVAWLALVLAAAGWLASGFALVDDITLFVPEGGDLMQAQVSRALSRAEIGKRLTLAISSEQPAATRAIVDALAEALRSHASVADVTIGPPDGIEATLYDLYFPRRFAFLALDPTTAKAQLDDAALNAAVTRLRDGLSRPEGILLKRVAPRDPLLLFPALVQRQQAMAASLAVADGRFVAREARTAFIIIESRDSPFGGASVRDLLTTIDTTFAHARALHDPQARLDRAGIHPFAVATEQAVRQDIRRVAGLSLGAVTLLVLLVFRSPRILLAGLLPIAAGVLLAMACLKAISGEIHGLTLAFGTSLVGVAIDYPCHLFTHNALAGRVHRSVWSSVLLGAMTTIVGFATLTASDVPALRDFALFATVGITGALIATVLWVPLLLPAQPITPPLLRRLDVLLGALHARATAHDKRAAIPLIIAVAICALGWPRLVWVDDLTALAAPDPTLMAEQDRVRALTGDSGPAQVIIAHGATLDEALRANDALAARLDTLRRDGAIEGYRSINAFLWAPSTQEANLDAMHADATLGDRLGALLTTHGFNRAAFEPFIADLAAPRASPLTLETLRSTAVGDWISPFIIDLGDRPAFATFPQGVRDAMTLRTALGDLPHVFVFEQAQFLRETYGDFRGDTLRLIGLGMLLVAAVIWLRFRRLRLMLAVMTPTALAGGVCLGVFGLAGVEVNLLHALSLLMVLSLGADYAIFMLESHRDDMLSGQGIHAPTGGARAVRASTTAVVVAAATTLLSFGLLSFSAIGALETIGLTVAIGVLTSVVLAPLALHIMRSSPIQQSSENAS